MPGLKVLNEIPQQMPHHILGTEFTAPRISTCEGLPVPTDADDDIPVVDTIDENVFVHLPFSLNSTCENIPLRAKIVILIVSDENLIDIEP